MYKVFLYGRLEPFMVVGVVCGVVCKDNSKVVRCGVSGVAG